MIPTNKCKRKPMGKSIMDNQETLAQHWVHKILDEDKQNAT